LAHHFTRMLDQNEQDIERAAAKLDRLISLLENALGHHRRILSMASRDA
jgi:hypothetical protein